MSRGIGSEQEDYDLEPTETKTGVFSSQVVKSLTGASKTCIPKGEPEDLLVVEAACDLLEV